MTFSLPPLPYDHRSLEPYIDATTMHLHHEKHHAAYVAKLNDGLAGRAVSDILEVQKTASTASAAVRNNGGGHYNHSMFWKWMAPVGTSNAGPTGPLKEAIETTWGSVQAMRAKFNEAAATRFGSGWAWLSVSKEGLAITSTPNQDNPLMAGLVEQTGIPILGLDVWEHAYYLKYQNRRPEYIEQWWNVVNWDAVVRGYEGYALKGSAVPTDF